MIGLQVNSLQKIEYHYNQIVKLRNYFVQNCGTNSYEAYKIWASWIITHLCLNKQLDSFLPTEKIADDKQIIQNLIQKGSDEESANTFYQTFILKCNQTLDSFKEYNDYNYSDRPEGKIKITGNNDKIIIKYNQIEHSLKKELFLKLRNQYMRGLSTHNFDKNLLILLNHYSLLDGLSYQWAIPDNLFKYINKTLKLSGELFASPINCLSNKFWSLFRIDKLFSSQGSFFDSKYENLILKERIGGCYQVNPPFIENIFIKSSNIIIDYLNRANKDNIQLMFIYFMPNWTDSLGYATLKDSDFLITEIIIPGNHHHYYESTKKKNIKVYFNTHLLILSSIQINLNEKFIDRLRWEFK